MPSVNAIIGKWKMEIDTKNKQSEGAISYTMDNPFYLICNPWCEGKYLQASFGRVCRIDERNKFIENCFRHHRRIKNFSVSQLKYILGVEKLEKSSKIRYFLDEVVYMEGEAERQEYVLAEDGLIWRGSHNRLRPTVWKYAQFERDILDCALHLMNQVGKVRVSGRNDPVVITRCLSAAVSYSREFFFFAEIRLHFERRVFSKESASSKFFCDRSQNSQAAFLRFSSDDNF